MAIDKGNSDAMFHLGLYYDENIKDYSLGEAYTSFQDYDEMKKYYLMAIDKGNYCAAYKLGYYYQHIEINDDLMEKYCLMTIDNKNELYETNYYCNVCDMYIPQMMRILGNYYKENKNFELMKKYYIMSINDKDSDNLDFIFTMYSFGDYYKNIKDYEEMKKCYLLAINKENNKYGVIYESGINYEFGEYYENIEKNYEEMEKYYLIEINNGVVDKFKLKSLINLGNYYKNINNYDKMKIYYLMAIDMGDHDIMYKLGDYYENIEKNYDLMEKYYSMAFNK